MSRGVLTPSIPLDPPMTRAPGLGSGCRRSGLDRRSLPDEERRAIELAYFDGCNLPRGSHNYGQPEGTVKSRIRNGMRRMRAVLLDAGAQGERTRWMSHEEASELLGAYALDAVDADEVDPSRGAPRQCRAVGPSSTSCARWRVPWATRSWSRPRPCGRASAYRPPERQEGEERGAPDAVPERPGGFALPRPTPATRRTASRGVIATVGAFAVVAAAVAVVLGIGLVQANHKVSTSNRQPVTRLVAVAAALELPGHQVIDLESATNRQLAEFVVRRRAGLPGLLAPAQAHVGAHLPAVGDRRRADLVGLCLVQLRDQVQMAGRSSH